MLQINVKDLLLAKAYYEILKGETLVASLTDLSLMELCTKLEGHNLNGDLFDVNLGNICATISYRENIFRVSPLIELWIEDECTDLDITKTYYILDVSYKKGDDVIYRSYLYTGCIDKNNPQWVNDADKLAKDNLEEGEQVMDYKLKVVE